MTTRGDMRAEWSDCIGCANRAQCGLCKRARNVFYCELCVRRGDFVHSTTPLPDRFADKKLNLLRLQSTCKIVQEKCNEYLKRRCKTEKTLLDTKIYKERCVLLKLAIQQKRENIKTNTEKYNTIKEYNDQLRTRLPLYKDNVETVHKYSISKQKEIENRRLFLKAEQKTLFELRKRRLSQLIKFIFPIKDYNSQSLSQEVINNTERALAEASRPVKISENFASLMPIQILTSPLPFDGDYSAYCHWVMANKNLAGSTSNSTNVEPVSQNPAYRISAALAYSIQLLKILAFYLDVRLPYNISYGDFCSSELEEKRFKKLVNKLQCCSVVLLNEIKIDKNKYRNITKEPPLHALLRLCPVRPKNDFQDSYCNNLSSDDENELDTSEIWQVGGDKDFFSLTTITSDEEEPEPPEHLHWDIETQEPDISSSSPNSRPGLMANATASIVSIWRVFTK